MIVNRFSIAFQSLSIGNLVAVSLLSFTGLANAQEASSDIITNADQTTTHPNFTLGRRQGDTPIATAQWSPSLPGLEFTLGVAPAVQDEEASEKLKELHDKMQRLNQEQAKVYQEYYSQLQQKGDYGAAAQMWRQQANAFDAIKYYQDWSQTIENNESVDGGYWIGVQSAPLSSDVRSFLGLDEEVGLRIEHIIEDSPAAKAQLKINDVIIEVDDHSISSLAELVRCVNESKGETITLKLNRKGSEMVVQVNPEKRPDENQESAQNVFKSIPHLQSLFQEHLTELRQADGNVPSASVQFWGPAGEWSLAQVDIPEDVHFELHADGNGAFELTMKDDEEEYTVGLNKLSELPERMRVYAEAYLQKLRQQSNQMANWNTVWGRNPAASAAAKQWLYLHQQANVNPSPNQSLLFSTPMVYYGDYGKWGQRDEGKTANESDEVDGRDENIDARLDRLEELLQEMQKQISRLEK